MAKRDWVIKSISITVDDAKLADQVGNLSKFVRISLRRWAAWEKDQGQHAQPGVFSRKGACVPTSNCIVCWPDGSPPMEAWDRFSGRNPELRHIRNFDDDPGTHIGYAGPEVGDLDWIRSQVPAMFSVEHIDATGNEKAVRDAPKKKSRSFIGKMLNLLGL
jgi:hypothetical protein